MEKHKLSDLSQSIISGYNFNRVKSESKTPFTYKMLLGSSMKDGNYIPGELKEVSLTKEASTEHLTQEGDIIVKIHSPIEFLYITKDIEGLLVSINLYIIRCDKERVSSQYLAAYLNERRDYFNYLSTGTTAMKKISKKQLAEIEIPIPSMEQQENIEKVMNLYQKEIELFELKQQFYKSTLNKLFSEVR